MTYAPEAILLPLAKQDVNEIWLHISIENSPDVANRVVGRIYATLDVLAAAPLIGRSRREFPGIPRSFAVSSYTIFYVPRLQKNGIIVWRIVHGARDLRRIVTPPPKDQP